MKNKMFEPMKLYTSKQIINKTSLRNFQDLNASGRIEWVQDNSFGNKLYRIKQ